MDRIERRMISTGALFCALSVTLGALGAHALKSMVGPTSVNTWELAAQYQMYHGLAILAVAFIHTRIQNRWIKWAFVLFSLGILFFSGSLYLLALKSILSQSFISIIGPLTPIGGVLFIIGWISLIVGILKK